MRPFTPFFRCFSLLLWSGSALLALGASFDCGKAVTDQEKAICADARLSKLDDAVAAAYQNQRSQLSLTATAEVRQDQRDWLLRLRETCPGWFNPERLRSCLAEAYSGRLYMLQSGLQRIGGVAFFPRLLVLTAPDREKLEPNPSDPGFGVGRFSWPEIDNPTPPRAAWNTAVRKQAARMTLDPDDPRQPIADFDSSTVADTEIDVFYRLKAVNDRVISLELQNGTVSHGAPHPVASTISFLWWLDRGRVLKTDDVFHSGSGWEAFLARRCYEELTTGAHAKDVFADQVQRESLADPVKQVSSWTLDAQNFRVSFDEYSVPAREAGGVMVELSWAELKPYLAASFDPSILPLPIDPRAP